MIRFHLCAEDFPQFRFALSPLWEVIVSYRILLEPARHTLHLPWAAQARKALRDVDLGLLRALIRPQGYIPDFILPPPTTPFPEFAVELEQMKQTAPEIVRREAGWVATEHPHSSESLRPYIEAPTETLEQLSDLLLLYWNRVMAPHWPRIYGLLEGDVLYRSRNLAFHGPEAVFANLHPSVCYRDGVLEVEKPNSEEVICDGRGMLFIPLAFAWPDLYVTTDPPWQPSLAYSPRGIADLWESAPPPTGEALRTLLGPMRAMMLKRLIIPCATSELAQGLNVTPGAVSQHLGQLRQAGLVERLRQGSRVYYRLSLMGESLLRLFNELDSK